MRGFDRQRCGPATRLWGIKNALRGKPVGQTELSLRCPDLAHQLEHTRSRNEAVSMKCAAGVGSHSHTLSVTLKPVMSASGGRVGTLVYMEDISPRERLQGTIEELEATGQELQSANEELETTNEELQSANEELETTNEELQSTNEELMRRYRAALLRHVRSVLRDESLDGPSAQVSMNVHFTPLSSDGSPQNVLIMFEITSTSRPQPARGRYAGARAQSRSRNAGPGNGRARKKPGSRRNKP